MHEILTGYLFQRDFFENRKFQDLSTCSQVPLSLSILSVLVGPEHPFFPGLLCNENVSEFPAVILTAPVPKKFCQSTRAVSIWT